MTITTLKNGLTVIGEPFNWCRGAAFGIFVNTGARDEFGNESGISHFLEHMMFKGTAKRSALDINYHFGDIGAKSNAYTSDENTVYYTAIVGDYFNEAVDIITDMMNPLLAEEEFNLEKKVILEEIALYQDRPTYWFYERMMNDLFGNHSCGNSVLGTTESVSAISVQLMKDYLKRQYSCNNMVAVATGNFDWDKLLEQLTVATANWNTHKVVREIKPWSLTSKGNTWKKADITQAQLSLIAKGVPTEVDERFEFSVLATILGDSIGSKLYWRLVDTGIAEVAGTENDIKQGVGLFSGYAWTRPADLDQVSSILREVLSKPLDFTIDELTAAKNKLISRTVLGGESPMSRAMSLGSSWSARKTIMTVAEVRASIERVDVKSISSALEKYPLNEWCEYRLLPE
jgi:predicted Zn-dependent peptidase